MTNFNLEHKNDCHYLDIAANGNGGEKAYFAIEALRRLKKNGTEHAHLIEIGPGGGAALDELSTSLENDTSNTLPDIDISLVELEGVQSESLMQSMERFDAHGRAKSVTGDAREISDLFPDGANVITASAVLHEIYSYTGGYESIDETLNSITNTLHPGGYFSYRDVFSVENTSLHERSRHIYDRESWVSFAKLFLPHYLVNARHPYHHEDDKVTFVQDSKLVKPDQINPEKYLTIDAPVGVLRELQRHYITFRDYCWRQGVLGTKPILEGELSNDWLDYKNGHKRVHYERTHPTHPDPLLDALSETSRGSMLCVDGDTFDTTTGVFLADLFKKITEGDPKACPIWYSWLDREGSETYGYMTIGNLIGATVLRSLEVSDGQKLLLPQYAEDVKIVPRLYYNRFLRKQLSNPLLDAKQMILFKVMDTNKDEKAIAQSLDVVSSICTKETIAQVYGPIRKASKGGSK